MLLRNFIWQMTLRSSVMDFLLSAIHYIYLYLLLCWLKTRIKQAK